METYRHEIMPITDPDVSIPKSILVKVFRVITDDETGKVTEELDRTIEFFPKKYKKKRYAKNK